MLPALLLVAGAFYDPLTPARSSAAPLVADPLYSRRGTVLTGTASVLAVLAVHLRLGVPPKPTPSPNCSPWSRSFAVLSNRPAGRIGAFDIAVRYEAAQADALIGGDLYAVQDSPHGVRLIVGDVRGKGMGAVAAVAVVIGAFREAAEQEATLEAVAQRLERALAREGTRRDGLDAFEGFTTAVLAELPHGEGVVRLVNRGHPPPLLLHADGTVCALPAREPALPLGMGDLGTWPDRAEQSRFPGGATLLLYTDGLSEARDRQGRFYDPEARLAGRAFPDPGALLLTLAEEARRHSGGFLTDDMALLAVRRPS